MTRTSRGPSATAELLVSLFVILERKNRGITDAVDKPFCSNVAIDKCTLKVITMYGQVLCIF